MKNLPSNFPKSFNLLDYKVTEISQSYAFKYESDGQVLSCVRKVVLCMESLTCMVLYGEGALVGVRVKSGKWGFVRESSVRSFSDLVKYDGMVCALDNERHLHCVDHKIMKVVKSVEVKFSGSLTSNVKSLVEHEGKLWLVTWLSNYNNNDSIIATQYDPTEAEKIELEVFRLGDFKTQRDYSVQTRLYGWTLFVSVDWCYVVCSESLKIS